MRVGVVLAVRGPAPHLGAALRSVLEQEPAPDSVVVVDDASDEPVALPAGDGDVLLVRREERGGPAAARATGLAALGDVDLVALADADDEWRPGKLAAQLASIGGHAVSFSRAVLVDEAGRPTGEVWEGPRAGTLDRGEFARSLYLHNPIAAPGVVVRRAALLAAGGFESPVLLAEDYDLWLRLAARGETFVYEPAAEVTVRRHPASLSWDVAALAECSLEVHRRHASLVPSDVAESVMARDLRALAQGRIRFHRDYAGAREALGRAAALEPLSPRFRAIAALTRLPGARGLLGRR